MFVVSTKTASTNSPKNADYTSNNVLRKFLMEQEKMVVDLISEVKQPL